jgi:hypothetical protein
MVNSVAPAPQGVVHAMTGNSFAEFVLMGIVKVGPPNILKAGN